MFYMYLMQRMTSGCRVLFLITGPGTGTFLTFLGLRYEVVCLVQVFS